MITDHDFERVVEAWIQDGPDQLPDAHLDAALEEIAAVPQRRHGWLLRTFPILGGGLLASSAVAAVMIAVALLAWTLLPGSPGGPSGASPTPVPTPILSPTPAPTATRTPSGPMLVSGRFEADFGTVEIDAIGTAGGTSESAAGVSGSMDVSASAQQGFSVELRCGRTEENGILLIGGPVTESTHPEVMAGTRVAIVLQRGDPVKAILWFEGDTLARSCSAFLRRAPDTGEFLLPVEGDLELGW